MICEARYYIVKIRFDKALKKEDEAMQGKESSSPPEGGASVVTSSSSRKTQSHVTSSNKYGSSEKLVDVTAHGHVNPLAWDNMPSALRDQLEAGPTEIGRAARPEDEGGGLTTPLITDTQQSTQNGLKSNKKPRPPPIKPKGTKEYIVSDRDTLRSIAAIFDTTPTELKKLNKLMSDMVFPGKKLYVPDKDYIPSPPRSPDRTSPLDSAPLRGTGSPRSPASPPVPWDLLPITEQARVRHLSGGGSSAPKDIPVVRQVERQKKPGRVERLNSTEEKAPPGGGVKPLSEDQAKRLDQECYERFIKVNVKHITDGQGVVSGTLLVTPNAIMFDPNVSDTLVIEHGADMYGMIAPMETVISAAMYHDIAAMKLKGQKKQEEEKPEVYHSSECPLSKQPATQTDNGSHGDQDANGNISRSNSEISCSCDAETKLKLSQNVDSASDLTNQNVVGTEAKSKSKAEKESSNMADKNEGLSKAEEDSSQKELDNLFVDTEKDLHAMFKVGSEDTVDQSGASTVCDPERKSTSVRAGDDVTAQGHVGGLCSMDAASSQSRDQSHDRMETEAVATATNNATANTQQPAENISDTTTTGMPPSGSGSQTDNTATTAPSSVAPHTEHGNVIYFQQDVESENTNTQQAKSGGGPAVQPISIPDSKSGAGVGKGSEPPTPPNTPGILDRTLGSLSSIGSPISSNLTKVVNFSSGLFVRNTEAQGSVVDFAEMYPETPESVSQNVPKDQQDGQSSSKQVAPGQAGQTNNRHSREVTVESIVRLDDKPELFRNLADLVPKPAAQFEDPPLYLCLRIGVPINKTVSKTCPIESYKKRSKPEYWFSIPREKVDPLYAFFIQWSPDIYGGEDEINPTDRGFIVINEEDTEEFDLDHLSTPVEDHFKAHSMSKDWEIVNMEEARRRMSLLGEGELPLPELSNPSTIITEEQIRKLCNHLPPRAEGYPWTMVYSTDKHGFSLKTLYRSMVGFDSPILLCIKDTHNQIFGALINCPLRMSDHFYGTGESFLFTFYEEFKKFKWTGQNGFFVKGNAESLCIGAGEGNGLWMDGDIYHGRTQTCQTFGNELLTSTEDFMVKGMEAWAFV